MEQNRTKQKADDDDGEGGRPYFMSLRLNQQTQKKKKNPISNMSRGLGATAPLGPLACPVWATLRTAGPLRDRPRRR